jgi:hypothetical protein
MQLKTLNVTVFTRLGLDLTFNEFSLVSMIDFEPNISVKFYKFSKLYLYRFLTNYTNFIQQSHEICGLAVF